MSPFKRTQRAAAKQRASRGRHGRPAEPAVQVFRGRFVPDTADVPPELAPQDYGFPRVTLPPSRPLVTAGELLAALDGEDTQPLPVVGRVLDETPQPAVHEGLAPAAGPQIPVPSLPFLNAHAPAEPTPNTWSVAELRERLLDIESSGDFTVPADRRERDQLRARLQSQGAATPQETAAWRAETPGAVVRVGNALPERLTAPELMLLGREIPEDAPPAARHAEPKPPPPVQRDTEHPAVFGAFDGEFWTLIQDMAQQAHAPVVRLTRDTNAAAFALNAHMARIEAAHQAGIERVAAHEYAARLADASRPLPKRVPGATLQLPAAAAGRHAARELVSA